MAVYRYSTWRTAAVALLAAVVTACATHTDRLAAVMGHTEGGEYAAALDALNRLVGVKTSEELPGKWTADTALAVLDRAMLLQALGRYPQAARDLSAAEQELELIDLTKDPVGTLAGYVYSESAKPYKPTPAERLSVNAINMLNYLAQGDTEGAAVEARRFQAVRDFLDTASIDDRGVSAFGAYLSGFVFEQYGEGDRALRYYEDALALGNLGSLVRPAARLSRTNAFRGPRLQSLLANEHKAGAPEGTQGELLVVVNLGRVSHKVPERLPIGAAIGIAGAAVTDDLTWLTRAATKVIVYPELVSTPSMLATATLRIDDHDVELEQLVDLDDAVRREYDEMKPQIIAAALTRLAARAALAEGVRIAGQQESNSLGDILAFILEGTLVGLDRPDTRSWTMMPARVLTARVSLTPGPHAVEVAFDGGGPARTASVSMEPNGYVTVVVTEPR